MQYDFGTSQLDRFNLGTRYNPAPGRVLSLIYRYSRELVDQVGGQSQLKQTYVSAQWPLADNWTFLGAWNYSIPDRKTLEAVVGLEYNGGCWALRLVGQQLTTTTETHHPFHLRAARAERTGARGDQPPRALAAHGSRLSARPTIRRSSSATAASTLCRNSDGNATMARCRLHHLFIAAVAGRAARRCRSRSRRHPASRSRAPVLVPARLRCPVPAARSRPAFVRARRCRSTA